MDGTLEVLLTLAVGIGFVHTLIGVDHTLPFILVRAGGKMFCEPRSRGLFHLQKKGVVTVPTLEQQDPAASPDAPHPDYF